MIMRQIFFLSLLFFLITGSSIVQGQDRANKSKSKFTNNLWFGASAGLDLRNYTNPSYFTIALFPMVGYKITPNISAGPRIGIGLQSLKYRLSSSQIAKTTLFYVSEAAFARFKFFNMFFIHGEFEIAQSQNATFDQITLKANKFWEQENNAYGGVGYYSSGGNFGSEIYILYNFLEDSNTTNFPIQFRAGLTYNF